MSHQSSATPTRPSTTPTHSSPNTPNQQNSKKDMEFGVYQHSDPKPDDTRIDGRLDELRRGGCNELISRLAETAPNPS